MISDSLSSYPVQCDHNYKLNRGFGLWTHSDYWTQTDFVERVLNIVCYGDRDNLDQLSIIGPCPPAPASSPETPQPA